MPRHQHEETLQMIDLKLKQHRSNLRTESDPERHVELRGRIEELEFTKLVLVMNAEHEETKR